jgi:hypothetical protein
MNFKHIQFLLPLSIFTLKLSAQIEDLMRDKNITWIAETYNDFQLEEVHEKLIGKKLNIVTPLKFMDSQEGNFSEEFVFQEFLIEALANEKSEIFEDANCQKRLKWGKKVDTITTIDPFTLKTKLGTAISNYYHQPIAFLHFRAHQIVSYNAKKAQFEMFTLSIAPLVKDWNSPMDSSFYIPAFWIKAKNLTKKPKLKDKNIAWARRLNLSKGFSVAEEVLKNGEKLTRILKKTSDNMPIGHFLETVKTNPKIPLYPTIHANKEDKYSLKDRNLMLSTVDSMFLVNLDTYERTLKVTKTEKTEQDFPRLRLVQNWYWNSKKNRLEIYLVAAAPVEDMYDENLKFKEKYQFTPVPILYRCTYNK